MLNLKGMHFLALHEVISTENNLILEAIDPIESDVSQSTKAARMVAELKDKSEFHFILKFRAFGLADTDIVGKSDALLEICTLTDKTIYKSEVLKNNLNPRWKPFSIPISKIAPKNKFENLLIKVCDYNVLGKNDLIGIVRFSGKLLVAAARQHVAMTWKLFEKPGLALSGSGKEKVRGKLQLQYVFANRRLPEECDLPGLQDSLVFYQRTGSIFSQYDPEDPQQMEVHDFYEAEGKCDLYGEKDETVIFSSLKSSGLMDKKISSKDESDSESESEAENKETAPKKVKPSSRKGTPVADVKMVDGKVTLNKKEESKVVSPDPVDEKRKENEQENKADPSPSIPAEIVPGIAAYADDAQLKATELPKINVGADEANKHKEEPEKPETEPISSADVKTDDSLKPEMIQDPPSSPELVSSTEFDKIINQSEAEKPTANETTQKEEVTASKNDGLKIEGFKMKECNGDGKDYDNFVAIERSEETEKFESKNEKSEKVPVLLGDKTKVEDPGPDNDAKQPDPVPKNIALPKKEVEPEKEPTTKEEPIIMAPKKVEESSQVKRESQTSAAGSGPKTEASQNEGQSSSSTIAYVVFGLIAVVVAVAIYHWRSDS